MLIRRPRPLVLLAVPLVALVAACSSSAAESGPTTTAEPVTEVPTEIPAGTTLRVGDQLEYLHTILQLGGEDEDLPYKVEYSAFLGGPPMLQAFQADAIDVGFVASTPLLFAQAGGQDIAAVGGWGTESGGYDLVVAAGVDDIDGWEDLPGHSVAFQKGTALQAATLRELDASGASLADITTVDLSTTQVASALQNGAADAGVLVEPLTSAFLAANPDATVVDRATDVTDRSSFLIAARDALDDDATSAAIADYVARLARAFTYLSEHRDLIAQSVYVDTYQLPPARAAEIVDQAGDLHFLTLPDDILEPQQHLADLFYAAGEIPDELDVSTEFDDRYATLIAKAVDG